MRQKPTPSAETARLRAAKGDTAVSGKVNGRGVVQPLKAKSRSVRRQLSLYKKIFADLG